MFLQEVTPAEIFFQHMSLQPVTSAQGVAHQFAAGTAPLRVGQHKYPEQEFGSRHQYKSVRSAASAIQVGVAGSSTERQFAVRRLQLCHPVGLRQRWVRSAHCGQPSVGEFFQIVAV